jgi:hypothetical protein
MVQVRPPIDSLPVKVTVAMHFLARNFLILVLAVAGVGLARAADEPKPLQVGDSLPGAFQVLMVTGDRAGKFHCPVCEFDLYPAVLIFVRDVDEATPALMEFLKKLDSTMARYTAARPGACVVFLKDGGYRKVFETDLDKTAKPPDLPLTKATLIKEDKVAKLATRAKDAKLKYVTFGLGPTGGPEGYRLDPKADITVLLFYKQQIKLYAAFDKEKPFTAADGDKVLKEFEATASQIAKPARRKS